MNETKELNNTWTQIGTRNKTEIIIAVLKDEIELMKESMIMKEELSEHSYQISSVNEMTIGCIELMKERIKELEPILYRVTKPFNRRPSC
jgi:hypothetical protein|tara:strand:+ start:202 stop:471 length:270 start_codon:yes stop_codon:yes gene_type:complete